MGTLVFFAALAAIVFWMISAYNKLVRLKNQVVNAWKQIDVQLKRRHDLIPNLVSTVKGAMDFEKSALEAVINARARAMGAEGVRETAQAEGMLTQSLGRLFALAEAYPDLKATGNIGQLQGLLRLWSRDPGLGRRYGICGRQNRLGRLSDRRSIDKIRGLSQAFPD